MKQNNDFVSIIVPVYNSSLYLDECILSILNQDYSNFELILVDDGSTDNSLDRCYFYAAKDKRIKVFHKENGGVSSARNFGLDVSTGDYILFVDSDDFCEFNMINMMISNINNNDLCICGICIRDSSANFISNKSFSSSSMSIFDYCETIFLNNRTQLLCGALYNKLFKRSIITNNQIRFSEGISFAEDFMFIVDYIRYVNVIQIIDNILYNYRSNVQNSLTFNNYKKFNVEKYWNACMMTYNKWKNLYLSINKFELNEKKINVLYLEFLFTSINMSFKSSSSYSESIKKIKYIENDRKISISIVKKSTSLSFKQRLMKIFYKLKLYFLWYILSKFKK